MGTIDDCNSWLLTPDTIKVVIADFKPMPSDVFVWHNGRKYNFRYGAVKHPTKGRFALCIANGRCFCVDPLHQCIMPIKIIEECFEAYSTADKLATAQPKKEDK